MPGQARDSGLRASGLRQHLHLLLHPSNRKSTHTWSEGALVGAFLRGFIPAYNIEP
jgi:hypothetical protein